MRRAGSSRTRATLHQRYMLDRPANPVTAGANAGKFPQGIVINRRGTRAYVTNFVSRNISVVDLTQDKVLTTIRTAPLPAPGSPEEVVTVGAEIFFSSRGNFNRPAGAAVSTTDRLSSEGWQSCSSCHFEGLTDSIVWQFGAGPRKSVPLNATFNPNNPADQRVLNYSAIFDEVEDSRPTSATSLVRARSRLRSRAALHLRRPARSTPPVCCSATTGHHPRPCVVNAFAKANAGRPQHR